MLIQADGRFFFVFFFLEAACGANVCPSDGGMNSASALRWAVTVFM